MCDEKQTTELTVIDKRHHAQALQAPTPAPNNPAAMVAAALEQKADVAVLERLLDLQLKYEANEARKAYARAMAAFKSDPPRIFKDKEVSYSNTNYRHASLGNVVEQVTQALALHGLTVAWDIDQGDKRISVTCAVTHTDGHSEKVTLSAGPDNSGKKNPIQQVASTVTYLQRYTLLAAVGLATEDGDNDGRGYDDPGDPGPPPDTGPKIPSRAVQAIGMFKRHGIMQADMERKLGKAPADWTEADISSLIPLYQQLSQAAPQDRVMLAIELFDIEREPGQEG